MPLNEMLLQTLLGRKLAHIISVPEYNFYKFGKDPMEGVKKSLWGAISMCTL